MGKNPAQIVALHMRRLSERQMTKRLQCSKSSVHRAIEKFKKREIYDDTKKTDRPNKLHEEMLSDKLSCNPPLDFVAKYVPIY